MKRALLLATAGALLLYIAQSASVRAQAPDALAFFKNYFITGNTVVGGVGLRGQGINGIATGAIAMDGVPEGADIVAAYLYWQVQLPATAHPDAGSVPVTFKGHPLSSVDGPFGKLLANPSAVCFGGNGDLGQRTHSYRADVLRFFDIDERTGKFTINEPHQVQLPDGGGATALGASLVVVYRASSLPLRAIVLYDGGYTLDPTSATMAQRIQGFYQPATTAARLTHIVGSGRALSSERLGFNGATIAINPFTSAQGESWDNPTFNVSSPVNLSQVTTSLDHEPGGGADCLTWSAIIYQTDVQDSDGDGLLDIWESSASPLFDPRGAQLPLLSAMGADPHRKDLFVEAGFMDTAADTPYGGVLQPAHSHLPSHDVLKRVGDAFRDAPDPVVVHFDMGPAYPAPGAGEPSAEAYLIRGPHARGGEAVSELSTVCERGPADPSWVCQFSAYPGTVGWKTGFRFLRDEVLSVTPPPGSPVPPPGEEFCDTPGYTCNRRFDPNRKDMFRYAFFAHAIALPKSEDPASPEFNIPRTNTGVGDFPGGDLMVTLGGFPDANGKPGGTSFMQASTFMHELGHNFERRHGGEAFEPNCKPTYLSVMNYLYQLRGLLDDQGTPHLDFSRAILPPVNEMFLADGSLGVLPYRIGWYAPLAGSYLELHSQPVARHCDGTDLAAGDVPMIRIDNRTSAGDVDWHANGLLDSAFALDVNFNGRTVKGDGSAEVLGGSNDWAALVLNQTGARRNTGGLYIVDDTGRLALGPLSLDSGRGDLGRGDLGRGDLGRGDLGRGDLGRGDLGRGDLGRGDLGRGDLGNPALGRGDLGRGDLGGGDLFQGDPNNPGGELDFEMATDFAKTPPNTFSACTLGVNCPPPAAPLHKIRLDWRAPNVGNVTNYIVYRVAGADLLPGAEWTIVQQVASVPGQTEYSALDASQLPDGAPFTFFAVAVYTDGTRSDPSNLVTISGVNDAPSIGEIGNQTIDAGTSTGPVAFAIGDEDAAAVTLAGTSGNPALVPHANIVFGGAGENRTVAVTPAAGQSGAVVITVTATDAGGRTAQRAFTVTVNPVIVHYGFTGFKDPLKNTGTDAAPTDSGKFKIGRTIPLKWQVALPGNVEPGTEFVDRLEAVPGFAYKTNTTCTPSGEPPIVLIDPDNGLPSPVPSGDQFVFNWQTEGANRLRCYRLRMVLNDGSEPRVTIIRFDTLPPGGAPR